MTLNPSNSRMRTQATVAAAVSTLIYWRVGGTGPLMLALTLGGLAVLAWAVPAGYRPVFILLDRVIQILVQGVSWVLLALVYFGIFTPFRILFGILGKNRLGKAAAAEVTALCPMNASQAEHFRRQY